MNLKILMNLIILGFLFFSCEKEDLITENTETSEENEEIGETSELDVEKFIYAGMKEIYLYKDKVPQLADSYFPTDSEKNKFLGNFGSPENLFEGLKYLQDRFSFLTDDYFALEDRFNGITSSTSGMKYGLGRISGSNKIFGFIQYVLPGTSAEKEGLTRGTVFTEIDGQQMTLNNYSALFEAESFTINIGKIEKGKIILTDKTISLNKTGYTTNPVYIAKTLNIEGKKLGYLMYNSFTADFDDELNAAFADFKAENVTDLVLDLRYNGGGSVETAVDLSSMITGQFEGEIFMKEQWNDKYQESFESDNPESLINRFDSRIRTNEAINSLNLSKVYILTTETSASASELVINGLEPYIDVIQVGETTTGKFQASVTLYDSPNFSREDANPDHTYAIQPLVFKSANAAGKTDYVNGLKPDIEISESMSNLGTLGEPSEPLLQAAINHLLGKPQEKKSAFEKRAAKQFQAIGESGMNNVNYQRMYIDKIPSVLQKNME